MTAPHDVLGIGNAIVDVLADTGEEFLARRGLVKGTMTLITAGQADELYREMGPGTECCGGSAANTMVGLASFGGRASFIGKVRDDALGRVFREHIRGAGVAFDTPAATEGPPTGRCLILVTPDGQRTMQTYLGAAAALTPEDIDPEAVRNARLTYLEGYLFDPAAAQQAFRKAAEVAHAAGRQVALTLSDPFCVERHRAEFLELLERHVDVLFANEAEILSLFETQDLDAALRLLGRRRLLGAVTRSARGSLIVSEDQVIPVPAEPVDRVVDTTGAGDLYASGFLFGLTRGMDLATCGRLGSIAAAEVIGHYGARPESSLAERVRGELGVRG